MLISLALLCLAAEPASPLSIASTGDGRQVRIVARLTDEILKAVPPGDVGAGDAQSWLTLRLVEEGGRLGPPIFGKYRREGDALVFTPRYALAFDHTYRATLVLSAKSSATRDYRVPPRPKTKPPVVERIFPSSDVLPANQLKFYIQFSQPMREGESIFQRIAILDEEGKPVEDPWRRTELWTADATRFSLWIHPGRIKTGVNLREEFGPVLKPDKTYTLVIRGSVEDAAGQQLGKDVVKKFKTTAADDRRPLPQAWRFAAPRAGTREPLAVEFGEPLDHGLLRRCLDVTDAAGKAIAGEIRIGDKEMSWSFVPRNPWQGIEHSLRADELLEDLAGNTPRRVFDTDLDKPVGPTARLTLPFRPR